MSIRDDVVRTGRRKILFTHHALDQMNKPERLISPKEVESIIFEGEIIEDYPSDSRGHSCLMLGWGEGGRAIHIVCAPQDEYLSIITAYIPNRAGWDPDFKKRRR